MSGQCRSLISPKEGFLSANLNQVITFDMGGTSTDVSLLNGQIRVTSETEIGGWPIRIPVIDIHTVGSE
ncbi:MAG: hydantoinase/oxoprolinase family protein [Ardenticatenaceae bacterium]